MVPFKWRFKGETSEKWHMLPLVDVTDSGIEISKWVGRCLEILVECDEITEGWVFQNIERRG